MDLISKRDIKKLLKEHQARPSKGLGQNFLIDKAVIKKIIKEARLQSKDIVLEIGPGIGTLTQEIAKKARLAIAVEKDPGMCRILRETTENLKSVKIIQGDILKLKFQITKSKFQTNSKIQIPKSYKIVANLPFYIVSPVIRKFLESENPPKEMLLVVQKEVAQRICAKPPDMNLLSVSVQFYAEAKIISYVSKKSFWPKPEVDGAILRITQIHTDKKTDLHKFFRIVKAGFSQPRKQLANNLSKKLALNESNRLALNESNGLELEKERTKSWLLKNNIQPAQRAETLTIKDWINLTKSY